MEYRDCETGLTLSEGEIRFPGPDILTGTNVIDEAQCQSQCLSQTKYCGYYAYDTLTQGKYIYHVTWRSGLSTWKCQLSYDH